MRAYAGKVLGGILGFAFGGPMGSALGFVLGHLHDNRGAGRKVLPRKRRRKSASPEILHPGLSDTMERATYSIGVIVLGAKMAKADGRVSREEVIAFKRVFRIPESQVTKVGKLFDEARMSPEGFEPYAMRLAQVFRTNPNVLEEILGGLFQVAGADSQLLSQAESRFLRRVATFFNFGESDFIRLASKAGVRLPDQAAPAASEPDASYRELGLAENAGVDEIKRTYRVLIRKHHPDRLAAQGLPADQVAQANEKMKRINAAYAAISKARGIK